MILGFGVKGWVIIGYVVCLGRWVGLTVVGFIGLGVILGYINK